MYFPPISSHPSLKRPEQMDKSKYWQVLLLHQEHSSVTLACFPVPRGKHTEATLPRFVLRCPQFTHRLLSHHQCQCQHREKGKCLSVITKQSVTHRPRASDPQGVWRAHWVLLKQHMWRNVYCSTPKMSKSFKLKYTPINRETAH